MPRRFVELGHVLKEGMPVLPGFPAPRMGAWMDHDASRRRYGEDSEFFLGKLELPSTNVGTYIDAPFHRHVMMPDLSKVPLERVADLPGIVVDATPAADKSVTLDVAPETLRDRAVLVRTGWSKRWGLDDYWDGPYLSKASLDLLLEARPTLVGVDFSNVDDAQDMKRPAHTRLLGEGILLVEHLTGLARLPRDGFRFHAVPLRVELGASLPVRAFAIVDE